MGGSSPNSDYNFFLAMLCFLCFFGVVFMFPKKNKNEIGGEWVGFD